MGEEEPRRGEKGEVETHDSQLATIRFHRFTVIRANQSVFAVIKKKYAAITPLGDFDMRPVHVWGDKWMKYL